MQAYPILPLSVLVLSTCGGCVYRPPAHWGAPEKTRQDTISYASGRPKEVVRREFWYKKPDFIPGQLVSRRITTQEFDTLGRLTQKSINKELVKQAPMTLRPLRGHYARWYYDSTGRVIRRRVFLEKNGDKVRGSTRPN